MQQERVELFGTSYTYQELRDLMPDISRVAGIKPYTLFDGPERGVFAIDVWTGSGLRYSVVPDRGMNICNANFKGIPLDWSSGTGITSPFLYNSHGSGSDHSTAVWFIRVAWVTLVTRVLMMRWTMTIKISAVTAVSAARPRRSCRGKLLMLKSTIK